MKPPTTEYVTTAGASPNTTTIANLVRRLGDLEVPVSGRWTLVPSSHVAIALPGRSDVPVPARILDGAFELEDVLEHSKIELTLDGPDAMTFVGQPTSVVANRHGLSEWSIVGTLAREGRGEPMAFTVSYHGVFRSRGRAWAWFSGSGAVESPVHGSWWRRSQHVERRLVVLDLLLDSPAAPHLPPAVPLVA